MRARFALMAVGAALAALAAPRSGGAQHLAPDLPPELFELEQIYILPQGVFHGYARASATPLVGGGDVEGPFVVGGKFGVHRIAQVEVSFRDRLGADVVDDAFDPLDDPFADPPPDTANDVRAKGLLRFALPAPPLDVISASGGFITSIRGEETVLLELSLGAAHRFGDSGPMIGAQVLHRRGAGSDEGPQGGDIESTSIGAMAMTRGGPFLWSFEGRWQFNSGEQPSAGRFTPGIFWAGPIRVGLGVPVIVTNDGTRGGLSATVGIDLGDR